jgi:uncharacterized protein (TIGR00730 family)
MPIRRACVFCASSQLCDPAYQDQAARLGRALAEAGIGVVYGGGSTGLMGAVADAALAAGGAVAGVLPRFMEAVEWGHPGLSEMHLVEDMHERLKRMKELSDAFIALPGGCGTLDELLQTLTWKRLGLHVGPIVIVNVDGFFEPLLAQLERCIAGRFMDQRHGRMWIVVEDAAEVVPALRRAPAWDAEAIRFARPV